MSTAVAPPAPTLTPENFKSSGDAIESLLEGVDLRPEPAEDVSRETEVEEVPVIEDEVTPEPDETEESDVPAQEDDEEDEDLDSIQDGKKYRVNPTKMRRLLNASKFMKAVQEHYEPTPEAALEHYQAATALSHMTADFRSADPSNITEFLKHWAGESPEGFARLAAQVPGFLFSNGMNQPLQAIENQVANAVIARSYSNVAGIAAIPEAQRTEQQKTALYRAKSLEFGMTGSYKTDAEIQQMATRPAPQIDRREQDQAAREKNFYDAQWNQFNQQHLEGAKNAALQQEIDAALKPVEGKYSKELFSLLQDGARKGIESAMDKRAEWKRNLGIEESEIERIFRHAVKTNSKTNLGERVTPLIQQIRQFAQRQLPGIIKPLIAEATQKTVDASEANHARLAKGAKQSAPSGGGKSVPRSTNRTSGQTVRSALDALIG